MRFISWPWTRRREGRGLAPGPWRPRRRDTGDGATPQAASPAPDPSTLPGQDELGIAPRRRRRATARLLGSALADAAIPHAVDEAPEAVLIAVPSTERARLVSLLRALGREHPALQAHPGRQYGTLGRRPAHELAHEDLVDATWVDVGVPLRIRRYRVGREGFARLLLVEWDPRARRLLALHPGAHRADWTGALDQGDPPPRRAAAVDRRRSPEPGGGRGLVGDVDVVYTWVDAADPAWASAYRRHADADGQRLEQEADEERFRDRDELRYSLRSLELLAPFVRHVYLVTADQVPAWLDTSHPRLSVVPHRELFPDPSVLPTFNSHAIEACLHRIPGLSEHYLYLNDDVLFGREVARGDFFTMAGLAKIRFGSRAIYQGAPPPSAIPTDWAAHNAVSLIERDLGLRPGLRLKHVPLPQRRSVAEELEARYPEALAATRRARFRAAGDVAVPSMLAPFYAIATGRGVEWPHVHDEYVYADTGRSDWPQRRDQIVRKRPKFVCLNATRYRDIDLDTQAENIGRVLEDLLPVPSSFERAG